MSSSQSFQITPKLIEKRNRNQKRHYRILDNITKDEVIKKFKSEKILKQKLAREFNIAKRTLRHWLKKDAAIEEAAISRPRFCHLKANLQIPVDYVVEERLF